MRAFWIAAETLDLTVVRLLSAADRLLGRRPWAERVAEVTDKAPDPTAQPKYER